MSAAQAARKSFVSVFSEVLCAKATINVASLIDAAGATQTISVPGVALGDLVLGVSFEVDLQGITVTAYVSAADVVSIRVQNESTATVDLASTTVTVIVAKRGPAFDGL